MFNIDKQLIKYIFNGGFTTLVNYIVYFILTYVGVQYLIANTIAWLVAVLVAFYTNRLWVFQSNEPLIQQLLNFVSLRALTLLIENGLLYVCIQLIGIASIPAKLFVSVITVIANYGICKSKIFRKGEQNYGNH
ncbi:MULTISPECIES: GtrA family protein [unclassified Breznakia]|uniref:GtrA family protein n=1 Tax=unclassified Breznakia TaxID=2623764 RepID=UPI002474C583|nr:MULTISPECIES: GtrA family protein [unclassified Breznakia]MDH6366008.1 putative flippase GtrA [Breznakia sp. PH1-1]MDH6403060.1 putative flippase GtrA [Breznakia sp. PF1-11]MDH6410769.1 putative flippase GtrA [Breznakia sp. PFB1-11]MDH6413174.1 putative flippase GtrA [Breznakia sp. PFB1-14]MDH6415542.1 putative flippase GtrA [Breznakia sp. PFB1-4]